MLSRFRTVSIPPSPGFALSLLLNSGTSRDAWNWWQRDPVCVFARTAETTQQRHIASRTVNWAARCGNETPQCSDNLRGSSSGVLSTPHVVRSASTESQARRLDTWLDFVLDRICHADNVVTHGVATAHESSARTSAERSLIDVVSHDVVRLRRRNAGDACPLQTTSASAL